ncbi:MAG: polysaccharide biosynthesis protein, partial [Spirochaetales bacterium]|nr:polysaccharide biosynthesis protein [Spirochaetales bacterium]
MGKTKTEKTKVRWPLVIYDLAVMIIAWLFVFGPMHGSSGFTGMELGLNLLAFLLCIMISRGLFYTYNQIWRYGGTEGYMRIIISEAVGFAVYFLVTRFTPIANIPIIRTTAFVTLDCLGVLVLRMSYRFCFKFAGTRTLHGRFLLFLLRIFAGIRKTDEKQDSKRIKVAIVGAGNTGVTLATELNANKNSVYEPRMFIDVDAGKVGRYIQGVKVYHESDNLATVLVDNDIQEIIFAVHEMDMKKKKELYGFFSKMGFRILTYDSPKIDAEDGKSHLREFSVEELLFRRQQNVVDDATREYYRDKTILITGGGGSIGSELCRQLATMNPKKLVILDIYENGAYDVQQELRLKYKGKLDLQVEICSITNLQALERVFETYKPEIVINAAAHKHVPLMEHNCIEAIENNVFGCRNVIECCEKYGAERFMMVSTDKAVN